MTRAKLFVRSASFCLLFAFSFFVFGQGQRNLSDLSQHFSIVSSAHADESRSFIAHAGNDRKVAIGQSVRLDASKSFSPSGRIISYAWKVIKKPSGSAANLSDPRAVRPTFTVDIAGDYIFELSAHVDGHESDDSVSVSRVTISTNAVRPVASAGLNRKVLLGETIGLDGAASTDSTETTLSYQWRLIQKPAGSRAILSETNVVRPKLTIDKDGVYLADLVVTNAAGLSSAPSRVAFSTRDGLVGKPSAGPDQTIAIGTTARLDADGTYSPNGLPGVASWSLISAPRGSRATLGVGADARQTLTPDIAGDYVVQMMVGGASQCEDDDDFDDFRSKSQRDVRFATVLVTTGDVDPKARAGREQRSIVGGLVTLDGAPSTDANGDALTYRWALISKPASSHAALSDVRAVRPTFMADVAGTYIAQLSVADAQGHSSLSTVVVSSDAVAPVADAGSDQLARSGSVLALNGTNSLDPNGSVLSAKWSILGLGDQTTGQLTSPNELEASFNVPVAGVPLTKAVLLGPAVISLSGTSDNDDADHNHGPNGSLTLTSVGRLNDAGTAYSIWMIRNGAAVAQTGTLASVKPGYSRVLSVPPRSDMFVASPVVASPAPHKLLVAGKAVATINPVTSPFTDSRLAGGGRPLALSVVQLIVRNGLFQSFDDVVVSTVKARPLAVPAAPLTAYRATPLTLDGSASVNPNSTTTAQAGLTYSWALLSRPAGSTAVLVNPTAARLTFAPDAFGLYVAQLIVSDGGLSSRPVTIAFQVINRPPVAAIKAPVTGSLGQVVSLDGTTSYSPDGSPLTYSWTLTSVPSGSAATLSNATASLSSFILDRAGTYTAQLVVSDGLAVSAPATASITAQSGFSFEALGAQSVALGSGLTFRVRAVDPLGKAVTYAVTGTLPAGATFDGVSGVFSFRPGSSIPNAYAVNFTATNGKDVTALTVPITVTGAPGAVTSLTVQLLDAVDFASGRLTPVSGAVVKVDAITGASQADGSVVLTGLTSGSKSLIISGSTASRAPDGSVYADTVASASLIKGVNNTLDRAILLGRNGGGTAINGGGATVVANPSLGVTLTIAPNSAFNADGTPYTGQVTLGTLPANTPVNLPAGYAPCQLFTLSPVGVTFTPAAQLTTANPDHLPAGAQVDLWAFDLGLNSSRVVGVGEVSSDGQTIAMRIGGVPGGTVFAMAPRRAALEAVTTQPSDLFAPSLLGGGDLATRYSPPGLRQLNTGRALTFAYHSSTANPRPIINQNTLLGAGSGLPQTLSTKLEFAGASQANVLTTNLSAPRLPSTPALDFNANSKILQAGIVDASTLPTGQYQYSFLTVSKYACSAVGAQVSGTYVVNNQSRSPFGPGWQLDELQKLSVQSNGTVTIAEGSGRAIALQAQQAPDFLPDPVYIPVAGPVRGGVADLQGLGRKDIIRLGWKDASLNIILNKGNRQFAKTGAIPLGTPGTQNPDGTLALDVTDVALGDLNGDGKVDAALVLSRSAQVHVLHGASGGTFLPTPVQVESNESGGSIIIGDWFGRGIPDLMLSEGAANWPDYHVIKNDGKTNLSFVSFAPQLIGAASSMANVRFAGFEHDSLVGLTTTGHLMFFYGGVDRWTNWRRGKGVYADESMVPMQTPVDTLSLPNISSAYQGRLLAAADIDGSGNPSFAIAGTNDIHIIKWNGPGANNQNVAQSLKLPNGISPDSVTLAPLAKGNKPSVIVTAKTTGFYVFTNDGKGGFSPTPTFIQTPFRVGYEANVVDFDDDGIADIAVNDIDNDRLAIYFGKAHADGAFVAPIGDYTRLVKNTDGTYSRFYNDGTRVDFNASGFQTTILDPNGNTTSYSYNGQGQLTQIVDPGGAVTVFTYSGTWLSSVTDGAGRTTSFVHDAAGDLTQITDPTGAITKYLYDANHQLVTTIDPNSNTSTNTYSATGQLTKQTFPDGTSVKIDVSRALGLDAMGVDLSGPTNAAFVPAEARITLLEDAKGNRSETEVNEWGAVVRVTDSLGRVSTFSRDAANRVVMSSIPSGMVASAGAPTVNGLPQVNATDSLVNLYAYDPAGNITSLTEALAHPKDDQLGTEFERTTSFVYDPILNKLTKKTDAHGNVTTYAYDSKGNMVLTTDALGGTVSYTYDTRGLPLTKTDQRGNVTTYAYDASGNLQRTTDAIGTVFERYYDASGNLILSIDAVGQPIERRMAWRYDALNRLTQETSATGQVTTYSYDANGNQNRVVDPAGNATTRVFDALNRLQSETTPDSGTSSNSYDANGNVVSVTDASGAVSTFSYDAANRRIGTTDALGATTTSAYDLRDNLTSFTNAKGQTNVFEYDVFRRLRTRGNPATGAWPDLFIYRWDRLNNLTAASSPSRKDYFSQGGPSYQYDALNRLVDDGNSKYSYDAASNLIWTRNGVSMAYTYDALNRVSAIQYDNAVTNLGLTYGYDALSRRSFMGDSLGGTTSYTFDGEDRLISLTTPWGGQIAQTYDAAGRPLKMSYPNGLDADVSWEAATGRLATLNHRAGALAAPVAQFNHSYDIRGNLATLSELTGTKSFTYDKLERLTGTRKTVPAPDVQVESYTYDPAGNRMASHLSPSVRVDAADRVLEDGINTYSWSADGDLASRTPKAANGTSYNFTSQYYGALSQMRLTGISGSDGQNFNIEYDSLHRLRGLWESNGKGLARYYDGADVALEWRRQPDGNFTWVRYVHGQGTDQPLAMEIYPLGANPVPGTGRVYYFHADGEGSVRTLTDANAQVANSYDYDSFGRRLSAVEAVPQPYGWKAREFIPGPDIYYNRARFYDPVLGRFISEDPLGYEGGDSNLYAFTWNNPRNWSDPSGLSAAGEYGGVGGSAARSSSGILNAGLRVKCVFDTITDVFDMMEKERLGTADQVLVGASLVTCAATVGPKPKPRPKPKPDTCSIGGAVGGLVSFEAGTLIETEKGSLKIEDVKIGDSVAARDEFSGKTVYRPVTNLYRRTAPGIVHLSLDAPNGKREVLKVTSEHPFFVKGKGWTEVRKLAPGDQIVSGKGGFLAIADMRSESQPTLVYNFEVAQNHNYFAGGEGALAHNGFGAYVIATVATKSGKLEYYVGKGGRDRAAQSARDKKGYILMYFDAKNNCDSFKKEHRLIQLFGGVDKLINIRTSPGAKL